MYCCSGNFNRLVFCFGLFFFYLKDFLLNLKQACHGIKLTATFTTMALPQKGCGMEQQQARLCLVFVGTPSSTL